MESFIGSFLISCFICWYILLNIKKKNAPIKVTEVWSSITQQKSLSDPHDKQLLKKTESILSDSTHTLPCT